MQFFHQFNRKCICYRFQLLVRSAFVTTSYYLFIFKLYYELMWKLIVYFLRLFCRNPVLIISLDHYLFITMFLKIYMRLKLVTSQWHYRGRIYILDILFTLLENTLFTNFGEKMALPTALLAPRIVLMPGDL